MTRIRAGLRRQNAPAAIEQFRKAGFGSRLLCAGYRMTGDEVHAGRQMRRDVPYYRGFYGSYVRQNRARHKMWRRLSRQIRESADWGWQHHQVGAFNRRGNFGMERIGKTGVCSASACGFAWNVGADLFRQFPTARCIRN